MRRARLSRVTRAIVVIGAGALLQAVWIATAPAHISHSPHGSPEAANKRRLDVYGALPLTFEVNQGQADPRVDFLSRSREYTWFFSPTEIRWSANVSSAVPTLRMKLVGANPSPTRTGLDEQPGQVNYLVGSDPARWHRHIATYARVEYEDVYPGVDLLYYGNQRQLEYDFVVAPESDPRAIALDFDGVDRMEIDARGNLVLQIADGSVLQLHKPLVYQEIAGVRHELAGGYVLDEHRVNFQIGAYDTAKPLVIDPVFAYSTLVGGRDDDAGYAIAADAAGSVYVTGETNSTDFPLAKPWQRTAGGSTDVFVSKLSADGSKLLYSTYFGGRSADVGYGIAVGSGGEIFVTGDTRSTDFPRVKAVQPALGGDVDVFVAKLSADGSQLLSSTSIGGSGGERGLGIAVDGFGNACVTGYTNSTDFPTANPIQAAFAGGNADAFVLKLNANGSALIYSTYLGGGNDRPDIGTAIAADAAGNAYVTGFTNSRDFPTVKPLQAFVGPTDVFVAKLNPAGSALVYSTHLGGGADDEAMGIAVDASGNAYVTGETESPNFPVTPGAFSRSCVAVPSDSPIGDICAGGDAFISKLSPDGGALLYSTFLNGHGFEVGRSIAVDSTGHAYVTGFTGSSDLAVVNPVQRAFGGGSFDAFVVKLNPDGSAPAYSTYLGGRGSDGAYGIAVDAAGNAYVTGVTDSREFPGRNRLGRTLPGGESALRKAFVVKIGDRGRSQ